VKELLRRLKSVRVALVFWYGVIFLAGAMIFCGIVYFYLYRLQLDAVEADLAEEANWIAELVDVERAARPDPIRELSDDLVTRLSAHITAGPNNYLVVLSDDRGERLFESDNSSDFGTLTLERRTPKAVILSMDHPTQGRIRVALRRAGPILVQVGFTERLIDRTLDHMLAVFVFIVPLLLVLAVGGGWIMSGAVLDPVRRISSVARQISGQNLSERIPSRGVGDELDQLIGVMNAMIGRLEQSFAQMKEFTMNAAHELRTPLTILRGEAELALSRPLPGAEAQRVIESLLEEIARMSRMVDDLLTLAKADAGQLAVESKPVRLDLVLTGVAEDASILASSKNIEVCLGSNPCATISGDQPRLYQLFRALVSNAVQYTDPGGRVTISSELSQRTVCVRVADTGIGIPPGSLGRIFDRFYRVEQARTRASGGSGLGLTIAKWIAELHHATITVESVPGKGSEFTVCFPALPEP
jgi:two-component system OmpR family sensor kinase